MLWGMSPEYREYAARMQGETPSIAEPQLCDCEPDQTGAYSIEEDDS